MQNWQIPGWLWTLALSLLPLLITMLQGQEFAGYAWAAGVVAVLAMLLKLLQVYGPQPPTPTNTATLYRTTRPSRSYRLWLG